MSIFAYRINLQLLLLLLLGTCPAAGKDSAHSQRVLSHEEGYVGYDEGDACR